MRFHLSVTALACLSALPASAELIPAKQAVETDGARRTYIFKNTPRAL